MLKSAENDVFVDILEKNQKTDNFSAILARHLKYFLPKLVIISVFWESIENTISHD